MKKLFVLAISLVMTLALMAPACAASAVSEDQRYTVTEHYINNGDKPVDEPGDPDDDMLSMVPIVGPALELMNALDSTPTSAPTPEPRTVPVSPAAFFRTCSSLLDADGEVVTDIAIGETYTLETTIRAQLTKGEMVNLDASNLRVKLSGYMITHGYADYVRPQVATPIFMVSDRESEIASNLATARATTVEDNQAIVTYVKGSAELLTSDGTVIPLSDEEFLSQDGALIGNRSNDGALPAEATCTVRIKLETSEYRLLTAVDNSVGSPPIESTRGEISTAKDPTGNSMSAMPTLTSPWNDTVMSRSSLDEQQQLQEQLQQMQARIDRLEKAQTLRLAASTLHTVICVALFIGLIMLYREICNISKRIDDMEDDGFEDDESEDE